MKLKSCLKEKRATILERWYQAIIDTYPSESAKHFNNQDPFANPVGFTISDTIGFLYDSLLREEDTEEEIAQALDSMVRIRAVQDFSPSQAVAFVFQLKKVIRAELSGVIDSEKVSEEWGRFEERIDRLALVSFDVYMKCREKIYELRTHEFKSRAWRLLERANMVGVISEESSPNC